VIKENLSINELIDLVDSTNRAMDSSLMSLVSERLYYAAHTMVLIEDCLFYARIYGDKDKTGEGGIRRQKLIDDSEAIINLIRNGGLYP
jgi:hypothetical protein